MKDFAKSIRTGNAKDKNGKELKVGDTVLVKTDDPSLNGGKIVRISGSQVSVDVTGDNDIWTTPGNLCTKIGNAKTGNSNKEEIIQKKKEQGATLKVDNGQKLEFSDGTTYVKTSFSDDYREAHNHVGNKDYKYEYKVVVTFPGGLADPEKIIYADSDEEAKKVALKYTADYKSHKGTPEIISKKETGNKKVGNAWTLVDEKRLNELLKKGPSKMTDEEWKEFQELNKRADQENAKALKKLGNSKVGNSIYSDLASQYESKLKEYISKKDMDGLNVLINSCESQYKDMKSQSESFYQKYKDADDAAKRFNKIGIDAMNAKRNLK